MVFWSAHLEPEEETCNCAQTATDLEPFKSLLEKEGKLFEGVYPVRDALLKVGFIELNDPLTLENEDSDERNTCQKEQYFETLFEDIADREPDEKACTHFEIGQELVF